MLLLGFAAYGAARLGEDIGVWLARRQPVAPPPMPSMQGEVMFVPLVELGVGPQEPQPKADEKPDAKPEQEKAG